MPPPLPPTLLGRASPLSTALIVFPPLLSDAALVVLRRITSSLFYCHCWKLLISILLSILLLLTKVANILYHCSGKIGIQFHYQRTFITSIIACFGVLTMLSTRIGLQHKKLKQIVASYFPITDCPPSPKVWLDPHWQTLITNPSFQKDSSFASWRQSRIPWSRLVHNTLFLPQFKKLLIKTNRVFILVNKYCQKWALFYFSFCSNTGQLSSLQWAIVPFLALFRWNFFSPDFFLPHSDACLRPPPPIPYPPNQLCVILTPPENWVVMIFLKEVYQPKTTKKISFSKAWFAWLTWCLNLDKPREIPGKILWQALKWYVQVTETNISNIWLAEKRSGGKSGLIEETNDLSRERNASRQNCPLGKCRWSAKG